MPKPNAAHRKLAQWEQEGRLKAVITQNIDGLHQKAGSKEVLELHGSIHRNYCTRCGKFFDAEYMQKAEGVPHCDLRRSSSSRTWSSMRRGWTCRWSPRRSSYISKADVLIVGGTSLVVYPAAGLIDYYNGKKLVMVNKSVTPKDAGADLLVQGSIGEIFSQDLKNETERKQWITRWETS